MRPSLVALAIGIAAASAAPADRLTPRRGHVDSAVLASARPPLVRLTRGGAAQPAPPRSALADACKKIANEHMRGIIFGGLDGILTTFAIMAASVGARQKATTTLVLGLSTLLADAFSMAGGEYLSAKAENELLDEKAARRALLEHEPSPFAKGVAMFIAFLLFGSIPLIGFVGSHAISHHLGELADVEHSLISIGVTVLAMFGLGALKSQFGKGSWLKAGGEVVLVGGGAASVAYFTALAADRLAERTG